MMETTKSESPYTSSSTTFWSPRGCSRRLRVAPNEILSLDEEVYATRFVRRRPADRAGTAGGSAVS